MGKYVGWKNNCTYERWETVLNFMQHFLPRTIAFIALLASCSSFQISNELKQQLAQSGLPGHWEQVDTYEDTPANMMMACNGAFVFNSPFVSESGSRVSQLNENNFTVMPNWPSGKYYYHLSPDKQMLLLSPKLDSNFLELVQSANRFVECYASRCGDELVVMKKTKAYNCSDSK